MKNSKDSSHNPGAMSAEIASLVPKLDAVSLDAVFATILCMTRGYSNEAVIAAGNSVLKAHGRAPVSCEGGF